MNEIACPNINNNRSKLINNECDPDAIMIKLINNNNNNNNNKMYRDINNKQKQEETLYNFNCDKSSIVKSKASSTTSSCSDISEDGDEISTQDVVVNQDDSLNDPADLVQLEEDPEKKPRKTTRSMSDGQAIGEPFEVFPSLPDSVLDKLGLLGDQSKTERMNEDELEHKFISLSLAFTIDATTIQSRSDRQRRYRDQTEANLSAELERLVEKVHNLQPLCIDAETTELLTSLLAQVDNITSAADHAAIAAERFGAVQHEERLADSVQLMINHVNVLKKQRDSTRRQLQYTKRVLQDTNESPTKHRTSLGHINTSKMMTRRRASIATIGQSQHIHQDLKFVPSGSSDTRRIARRTSDLSLRSSVLARMPRPLRLELGLDLVKITEGSVDPNVIVTEEDFEEESNSYSCQSSHDDSQDESFALNTSQSNTKPIEIYSGTNLGKKISKRIKKIYHFGERHIGQWFEDSGGEFMHLCALLCFFLGFILLANTLVELESERQGYPFTFWAFNI